MGNNKAELELEFIKNIIADSRKKVSSNSLGMVIWGIIIIGGILFTYFGIQNNLGPYISYVWFGLIAIGWFFSYFEARQRKSVKAAKSFAVKVQSSLWLACGLSMSIIGIVVMVQFKTPKSPSVPYSYIINDMAITPIISIILGIAYFVTGTINDAKMMSYLAFGWWIGGIIIFYWKSIHSFPLFAGMIFFFQVIPGMYYYFQNKKNGQ